MTKVSFSLQTDVVDAIQRAVQDGRTESASAFVEHAVRAHLRWLRRRALSAEYARAASDRAFVEDMDEVLRDFDPTVGDGLDSEH